jgi:hypothetical protein
MITLINTTRLGRLTPAAADDDRRSADQRTRDATAARSDQAAALAAADARASGLPRPTSPAATNS